MDHGHCLDCNGLTEGEFKHCRDHCPEERAFLGGAVHSMVDTPGALTPPGVCGGCGYPSANVSFIYFHTFECKNGECPYKEEYEEVVYFQRVLQGRADTVANPCCPKCDNRLSFLRNVDESPQHATQNKPIEMSADGIKQKNYYVGVG